MPDEPTANSPDRFRDMPSSLTRPVRTGRARTLEALALLVTATVVAMFVLFFALGANVEQRVLARRPEICAHKVLLNVKGRDFQVCPATARQARWAERGFLAVWASLFLSFGVSYIAQERDRGRRRDVG
jgi:hypothetical protein